MIYKIVLELLILVVFLMFSALFSFSETVLFSLRKSELMMMAASQNKKEKIIAAVMVTPQKILITILLGNLFVNLIISALSTRLLLSMWEEYGHFIAILLVTPIIILFGEIFPKIVAILNPGKYSGYIINIINIIHGLFAPIRVILIGYVDLMIRIFGLIPDRDSKITEEDLDNALRISETDGVIGTEESKFIKNVLRFSKKEAQNIMIPRNQSMFVPYNATVDEAIQIFSKTRSIRLPVYKGDMDNVVGVLDYRDLLPYRWGIKNARNINRLLYSIYHYPSSKELGELLDEFLRKKIQIAVVVDEYGGTAGIVTLSSILSELLGRGFSQKEKSYKPQIRKIGGDESVISGDMQIDDYNVLFSESLASSESETIGGYILEKLGYFPRKNDVYATDKYLLRIRRIIRNRIDTIQVISRENV
jgi:putative hemolysin